MTARILALLPLLCAAAGAAPAARDPGLVVHLPAADGQVEIAFAASGRVLVQGLALRERDVDACRQALFAAGKYGLASVRRIDTTESLPFASNLVTHLVVDADALGAKTPAEKECLRVLHPGGVLHLHRGGDWKRTVKPMPADYGDWTHAYGGPDGAMRSGDAAVAAPVGLRWISGPACHDEGAVANGYRIGAGVAIHDLHLAPWAGNFRWMEGRNAFNGLPTFLVPLELETYKTRPMVLGDGKVFTYLRDAEVRPNGKVERDPGPLVALDAATGKKVLTFTHAKPYAWYDTGKRQRHPGNNLLFAAGSLFQTAADLLQCFDPASGEVRWSWSAGKGAALDFPAYDPTHNLIVVARGSWERLVGRNPRMNASRIVAVDARTGKEVWSTAIGRTGVADWSRDGGKPITQIACSGAGVYLYRAGGIGALKMPRGRWDSDTQYLAALDGKTGKVLWSHEGFDAKDRRGGENDRVFDVGGQKLEMTVIEGKIYLMSGGVAIFDARSGEKQAVFDFGNSRCDASHAAGNLLVLGFGNLIDLRAGEPRVLRSEIVRGHCATGLFPSYGMIFGTPSRCRCAEVLHAYLALSSDPPPTPLDDRLRLSRGDAPAFSAPKEWPAAEEWPVFLGNPARSSGTHAPLKRDLRKLWQAPVARPVAVKDSLLAQEWHLSGTYNGPVSAPTVAGGRLFVAVPYEHRVEARSLEEGKRLWSFSAGGRVDSPPTVYGGLCLFGAHDGWVYCLDAGTGKLRWKFLAAPADRQIVAYGQAESAWPLFGSVVVAGGTVVAIAGYHPETDGGLFAWGLEPGTGAIRWKRTLHRERHWLPVAGRKADEPSYLGARPSGGYHSNNVINSLPVAEGGLVSIQGFTFDAATGRPTSDVRPAPARRKSPPPAPLPDAVDAHMSFALAFNERSPERTSLYDTFRGPGHHNGTWDLAVPEHDFKIAAVRLARLGDRVLTVPNGGWHASDEMELRDVRRGSPRKSKPLWKLPLKTKSAAWVGLAIAGDTAVIAERTLASPLEDRPSKGKVELRSLADGSLLQSIELPAPPIENGLAVAGGRLYVTLLDGSVLCLGQ